MDREYHYELIKQAKGVSYYLVYIPTGMFLQGSLLLMKISEDDNAGVDTTFVHAGNDTLH